MRRMPTPSRISVLVCGLLAVATPFLAGALSWGYLDEAQRGGPFFYALYWPVLALSALPARVSEPLLENALPMVLLYFGGYLVVDQLVRALRAAAARRARPRA
jgi:hypothetical protein